MARAKQTVERNRQKKLKRRKQRERKQRGIAPPARLSRKLEMRLENAYDLINRRNYSEAEESLKKMDRRGSSYPEVVEALMFLYQSTDDHEQCCNAAARLTKLRPRDSEARIMVAQELMHCGQVATALQNYQQFIEQWPDHDHVTKAKNAIELLVPEADSRIRDCGFSEERGLECLTLHEESLRFLQNAEFPACIKKCLELLAEVPTFMSARNNLAAAYFQSGRAQDAIVTAEETRELASGNRFADALLAKLYFLTGRARDAHQLADQIVADPPTQPDPLTAALETLAFLGRDEDLRNLALAAAEDEIDDPHARAVQLHYLAYAQCRLGDETSARASWSQCLDLLKEHRDARENLLDLDSGEEHAPWAHSFPKWVPKETMDRVVEGMRHEKQLLHTQHPEVTSLIPALLDRGDPFGRQVAVKLAMADGSPLMLEALKTFAFGSRGPDKMRFEVLTFLQQKGILGNEPHRVYSRGAWTEIQIFAAEITTEPVHSGASPRALELVATGIKASNVYDFELAEASFKEAIEREPHNCSAVYNLCTVWLKRDGKEGEKKARERLAQLHQEFPDYVFATIALAQFASQDGDHQRAKDSLAPVFQAKKMHIDEAKALFTTQVQCALAEHDLDSAKRAFSLLANLADDDDPNTQILRGRIDKASTKGLLWRLLSKS